MMTKRTWTGLLLCALLVTQAGCGPPARKRAANAGEPGILIIVVDALRADKLGVYGYERDLSPFIDELAEDPDAVVYRRHYVNGGSTKKSTASLFTGLFMFQHGVIWGHEMQELPNRAGSYATQILREEHETMAERLQAAGFYTFGVAKSQHLLPEYGFAQGFVDYFSANDISGDKNRVRKTLELIEDAPGPFFGYLHLVGVHHPFELNERHPLVMEQYGFSYDETARASDRVDFTNPKTKFAINNEGMILDPDDVRFLNLVYDASVRHVDERYVGRLLRELKEIGRYDDTLIVLTADHGEELYDHRGYAHGHALWDEVINVPLIVKFPKGKKPERLVKEVPAVTQAVDLIPSFLSFFGHPAPQELPGTDIFLGEPRGSAYSEISNGWALIEDRYKLIVNNGITFLSDHQTDPGEEVNLALSESERLEKMIAAAEALREFVAIKPQNAPVAETQPDEEAIEALKSLGYLQ